MRNRHKWTEDLLAELAGKYFRGIPERQLAEDYGLTYESIRRVLIRYGIRPSVVRRPHVWDEGEEDQLIIDWERGFPTPEIRKRYSFNCNTSLYNRLYRIEQKRGIKIKRGRTRGL